MRIPFEILKKGDQIKSNFTEATCRRLKHVFKKDKVKFKICNKSLFLEPNYLKKKNNMKLWKNKLSMFSWSFKTKKMCSINYLFQQLTQLI